MGDYFLTGGSDAVVLAWQSNMNQVRHEDIEEIQAKINTEIFVTQKEKVDKLPSQRGTKAGTKQKKSKAANAAAINTTQDHNQSNMLNETEVDPALAAVKGVTYRKLKPEVKSTLEKVVYQLELMSKTL